MWHLFLEGPSTEAATAVAEPLRIHATQLSVFTCRLPRDPLPVSFEAVLEAFDALPRMFVELDGSFLWTGQGSAGSWQLEGVVYDRRDAVQHVELKGAPPREAWERFLRIFGWPVHELTIQLASQGRFTTATEFVASL